MFNFKFVGFLLLLLLTSKSLYAVKIPYENPEDIKLTGYRAEVPEQEEGEILPPIRRIVGRAGYKPPVTEYGTNLNELFKARELALKLKNPREREQAIRDVYAKFMAKAAETGEQDEAYKPRFQEEMDELEAKYDKLIKEADNPTEKSVLKGKLQKEIRNLVDKWIEKGGPQFGRTGLATFVSNPEYLRAAKKSLYHVTRRDILEDLKRPEPVPALRKSGYKFPEVQTLYKGGVYRSHG